MKPIRAFYFGVGVGMLILGAPPAGLTVDGLQAAALLVGGMVVLLNVVWWLALERPAGERGR